MEKATDILISPMEKIWSDLREQAEAWTTINNMLIQTTHLPARLSIIDKSLNTLDSFASIDELTTLMNESHALALDAERLVSSSKHTIIYPGLVGAWAIIEAAFDDLIIKILLNDPEATNKLEGAGIKRIPNDSYKTEKWAKKTYLKMESKAKDQAKGFVVETHKKILEIFGIKLEFPNDRARTIEELNQVRNCILHNQGAIDEKAINVCPRLTKYLGMPIPATDPLFTIALHILLNYTIAWIAALMFSPYLRDGLLKTAKNPFLI